MCVCVSRDVHCDFPTGVLARAESVKSTFRSTSSPASPPRLLASRSPVPLPSPADPTAKIGPHAFVHCLTFLGPRDVARCQAVSRSWCVLGDDPQLWAQFLAAATPAATPAATIATTTTKDAAPTSASALEVAAVVEKNTSAGTAATPATKATKATKATGANDRTRDSTCVATAADAATTAAATATVVGSTGNPSAKNSAVTALLRDARGRALVSRRHRNMWAHLAVGADRMAAVASIVAPWLGVREATARGAMISVGYCVFTLTVVSAFSALIEGRRRAPALAALCRFAWYLVLLAATHVWHAILHASQDAGGHLPSAPPTVDYARRAIREAAAFVVVLVIGTGVIFWRFPFPLEAVAFETLIEFARNTRAFAVFIVAELAVPALVRVTNLVAFGRLPPTEREKLAASRDTVAAAARFQFATLFLALYALVAFS